MTIAACFLQPEGVILAADSTTTLIEVSPAGASMRYFPNGQKVFEIGRKSSLGLVAWGCGSLKNVSHRTLIAEFDDELQRAPPPDLASVAAAWADHFWRAYARVFATELQLAQQLAGAASDPSARTKRDVLVQMLSVGFCIGGRWRPSRSPGAHVVEFSPLNVGPPTPQPLRVGALQFWGVRSLVNRLARGFDDDLVDELMASGKWTGTQQDLVDILGQKILRMPNTMPLRDAIELVHSMIDATIKAMKFSHLPPTCGGPIEVALITTDRKFRWVKHKPLNIAIGGIANERDPGHT